MQFALAFRQVNLEHFLDDCFGLALVLDPQLSHNFDEVLAELLRVFFDFVKEEILIVAGNLRELLILNDPSVEETVQQFPHFLGLLHEGFLVEDVGQGRHVFGLFNKEHHERKDSIFEGFYLFLCGVRVLFFLGEANEVVIVAQNGQVLNAVPFLQFNTLLISTAHIIIKVINSAEDCGRASPCNVLNARPFDFQVIVELIGADLLLKDDDRLHEFVEGFVKFFSGVPKQILGQFEPDFQYGELLEHPRVDVAKLLLVADTLLQEGVYLFLVVFDVVDGQDFALSIPTEKSKVLVSLVYEMLVDFPHNGGALTLLGKFDVAADFFDDFHEIYLFCGNDIADIGVDDCVLLEYLLILEIYRLLLLVLGILLDGFEAKVLSVVNNIVLFADYHSFAGLLLVDADLVVIEEVFFVLIDLTEIVGV